MTGIRGSRIWAVAPAALVVALTVAACGGTAATPTPTPQPSPSTSATPLPAATASDPYAHYGGDAIDVIRALGGEVAAGESPMILTGDAGSPSSVNVSVGDWQLAWDSRGVLRYIFWDQSAEGATPSPGAALTEAQIRGRVNVVAAALKLTIGAPKEIVVQDEAWMAAWPRLVDGIPAEENGTRIWVNEDGSFLQYSYAWYELAPKPAVTVTAAQAIAAVDECKAGAAKCEASLVWHLASGGDADAPLTLCWIVGPKGGAGEWRAWVDAGTGKVVDVAAQLN